MINLALIDVDGTLTDGVYTMGENGSFSKNFYTRDFHGLWLIQPSVKIGIMTFAKDSVITLQCNRAKVNADLHLGVQDKYMKVADMYLGEHDWENMAYIGDDVIDIGLLKKVGFAMCPADAHPLVLKTMDECGNVSEFNGGRGCVREFADCIQQINGASK